MTISRIVTGVLGLALTAGLAVGLTARTAAGDPAAGDPGAGEKGATPDGIGPAAAPATQSVDSNGGAARATAVVPEPGTARRVSGDMQVAVEKLPGGFYRCGLARITTELPQGYPDPTPPGAVEIKTYPSVRRAEVSGTMGSDLGMNFAFFPLFNHIKQREIAMTSPVEMDYKNVNFNPPEGGDVKAESWTMSFLYRTPELGPTGADERNDKVRVVDTPPVTVVAIGRKGPYRFSAAQKLMRKIDEWLAANPEWEKAGDPRALYYNGPDVRDADKWSEVQWPIRPRAAGTATEQKPADSAIGGAR